MSYSIRLSYLIRRAALVFMLGLAASAQVQKIDNLSFAVPEGWKYEYKPGDDHAAMGLVGANGEFCIISLTKPVATSGNADKDFAVTWRLVVQHNPQSSVPTPIYDIHGMMGYPGKYSASPVANQTKYAFLYVLETGQSFVPVVVVTPNRAVFDAHAETVRAVLGSVRLAPLVALPIQKTVSIADLVGDWKYGDSSTVSYVNRSTGSYAGSSTSWYGAYYTITSDGRYTYSFQGMTDGHIVRDKSAGVVEFAGEFVIFHQKPGNKLIRYHFIAYEHGLSGATLLTLLPESYQVTSGNTGMYAARFVREPLKK